MSQALASPASCCSPCEDQPTTQIPGPQGDPGTNGTNGTNGLNAYSTLTSNFTQPAVSATAIAAVVSSGWAVVGEDGFLEGGGYYLVTAIPDSTHVTLQNRGYTANVPPTTIVPSGARISPSGEKGESGSIDPSGALLIVNNLSDLAVPATALMNLGGSVLGKAIFTIASPSAIRFFRVNADNSVSLLSDTDTRIALGLVIGTNVQAYDDQLQAISQAAAAADKVPYFTGSGPNDIAVFTATTFGRSVTAQTTASGLLIALGKILTRQGLLSKITAVPMDATADTFAGILATRYRVTAVIVEAATGTLAVGPCTGGLFKTAGGLNPIAVDQTLAACVLPTNFASLTLGGIGLTDVFTADLIFRVGTPSTAGITSNIWIWGQDLS